MSDESDQQEPDPRRPENRRALRAGAGVAVGTGIGAAIFAATDQPVWIALGAGLGAAVGAGASRGG